MTNKQSENIDLKQIENDIFDFSSLNNKNNNLDMFNKDENKEIKQFFLDADLEVK
jgi:hypothetical protein